MARFVAVSSIISRWTKTLSCCWLAFGAIFTFTLMNAIPAISALGAFLFAIRTKPASMAGAVPIHGIALAVFAFAFGETTGSVITHVTWLVAKLSLMSSFAKTNSRDGVAASHLALAGLQAVGSVFSFRTSFFTIGSFQSGFAFPQAFSRDVIAWSRRRALAFLLTIWSIRSLRAFLQTFSASETVFTLAFAVLGIATFRVFLVAVTTLYAVGSKGERRTSLIAHFAVESGGTLAVAKKSITSTACAVVRAFSFAGFAKESRGTAVFAVDAGYSRWALAAAGLRVAFALIFAGAIVLTFQAVRSIGTNLQKEGKIILFSQS